MDITIVVSLIAGVLAALLSFLMSYRQRVVKEKENLQKQLFSDALSKAFSESFGDYYEKIDIDKTDYIARDLRNYLVHFATLQTKPEIEEQVNLKVDDLKKRLEAIEARFPQEATLEKLASVNDAILATKLETLADSIKTIQDKMLTKWDVAKIVFAIFSILGILVGLIFGIINLVN